MYNNHHAPTRQDAYPDAPYRGRDDAAVAVTTSYSSQTGHDRWKDDHKRVHSDRGPDTFDQTPASPSSQIHPRTPSEHDEQAAARRVMAKRSSRSFASRISRTRSRKMEVVGRLAKPGITVDTSFARHRGDVPHQMYPLDGGQLSGGSLRKQNWFGLGRSGTRTKGLGITKGTPQPNLIAKTPDPRLPAHRTQSSSDNARVSDPRTTESLASGNKTWQEISPWDRPIPIGISIPSDSVTDFSPYRRNRSDSDATLATPSIIITPAAAMKSVWSPDTASDYTPATSTGIYSRAFEQHMNDPSIPPVPALPLAAQAANEKNAASHARSDTLDSAGTAFEEEEEVTMSPQKDRILSTATVFEEDETPLRGRHVQGALAVDTAPVPTPRRSQGWWNVITTPFVGSPAPMSSFPAQTGDGMQKTPRILLDGEPYATSPYTPSSYNWSLSERSPSTRGQSPLMHPALSTAVATPENPKTKHFHQVSQDDIRYPPSARSQAGAFEVLPAITVGSMPATATDTKHIHHETGAVEVEHAPVLKESTLLPVVGLTAGAGNPMPRSTQPEPQPAVHVNIELQERRPSVPAHAPIASAAQTNPPTKNRPPPLQLAIVESRTTKSPAPPAVVTTFAPPPTVAKKTAYTNHRERSSERSPSTASFDLKDRKKPRQIDGGFMARLALCGRRKSKKQTEGKNDKQKKKTKRSRCCLWCGCCFVLLILIAILIPILVVFTKRTHGTPSSVDRPSQWLNLTGYPPMPTGVSTVAQPDAAQEQNGCVGTTTLWSCALPKEQQQSISPNQPNQPNFRFEIIFVNGTVGDASKTQLGRRAANPVTAGALVRSRMRMLAARAGPAASPAAPSVDDEKFLGQTTEKNSAPFEGEATPFFFNLLNAVAQSSPRLARRDDPADPTNITLGIPPPTLNPDGTAADANLLPTTASGQPIRLYNRGLPTEHYGFYTYFDRSIFLKDITVDGTRGGNPADTNGGSFRDAASLRCTYSQTRFLVQIWTRSQATKPLLPDSGAQNNTSTTAYKRPGSLPYPITITVDRHGGDATKKNVYCYKMQNDTTIVNTAANKFIQSEDRGFGGNLVSPPGQSTGSNTPIDGGSGGCSCRWQNWLD